MKKETQKSQIIIYKTETGETRIDVRFDDETVWLSQNSLAELFQTTKQNISQHIKNIFEDVELEPHSVVKDFLTTAVDGKNYTVNHYSLDLIISVGYRVKSSHVRRISRNRSGWKFQGKRSSFESLRSET